MQIKHAPKTVAINGPDPNPYRSQGYRWIMLALLWLIYFAFGLVVRAPSPLVTPMLRDLHMSYSQMGVVLGSWQMTYIVFAVISGVIIDRWGLRNALFSGALIIGLSAALRFYTRGFVSLLVFVSLFGIGGPMISVGAPKMIALWFNGKDRGTAVGIYTTGPWIGGMVAMAATNTVVMPLTGYSWRLTYLCYGLLTFGFALLWVLFAKEGQETGPSGRFNPIELLNHLLKVHNVRIILLSGLLSFTVSHAYLNWLPKILENTGMIPAAAGLASATPYITTIPAVLLVPRLVPPRLRGRIITLLILLYGASIMWVVAMDKAPLFGLLLSGACGPSVFPLLLLILMDTPEVGSKYLGSATGVFFCFSEMGGFLGPFIVGFLVDFTGTFMTGAVFLLLLVLVISSLMSLLKPEKAVGMNRN